MKHQTAYYHPLLHEQTISPNQTQMHDDPVPSLEDSLPSYAANPEEILMAKENLINDYYGNHLGYGTVSCYLARELNSDADWLFEKIAPTTTNLKERK